MNAAVLGASEAERLLVERLLALRDERDGLRQEVTAQLDLLYVQRLPEAFVVSLGRALLAELLIELLQEAAQRSQQLGAEAVEQ
eukprot:3983634-Alexandrium_andersonii.AAC.1